MGSAESLFDRTLISLGDIPAGSTHEIVYDYTGDMDLIEDVVAGCGCTSVKVGDKCISLTYTDNNNSVVNKATPAKQFTRVVEVYFKDGKPLKVPNERGELVYNKIDKTRVKLQFVGTAVL